jgi:hypothetical protein
MRRHPLLVLLLTASCSSGGWNGDVFHGDGFAFELAERPGRWQPVEVSDAALAYRVDATAGVVMINARCGKDGDDIPLQALTQHLFLQFTERVVRTQEVVPFDGREAMHTLLDAKLDGVPMRFEVWVLKKDGCVYDLLFLAPPEEFARGREDFHRVVQSFRTVAPDG